MAGDADDRGAETGGQRGSESPAVALLPRTNPAGAGRLQLPVIASSDGCSVSRYSPAGVRGSQRNVWGWAGGDRNVVSMTAW